jgi:hypothetical protein
MKEILEIAGWIIAALGGGGVVVVGLSAWLGKLWADRMLKAYQSKIDLALAEATSALRIAEEQSKIVYSSLHSRRAELIAEVYSKLVAIVTSIDMFQQIARLRSEQQSGEHDYSGAVDDELLSENSALVRGGVEELQKNLRDLGKVVTEHQIFFSADTAGLLNSVLSECGTALDSTIPKTKEETNQTALLARALTWRRSYDAIAVGKQQLESEFRALLGVERPS